MCYGEWKRTGTTVCSVTVGGTAESVIKGTMVENEKGVKTSTPQK